MLLQRFELVELFGLDGKDAEMVVGQAIGPGFVMKPALGMPRLLSMK